MDSKLIWYTARASGIVTWALLAGSVLWGLAVSTRLFGRRPRPAWLLDLHRFLGAAALVFLCLHVGSIMLDTYVHFGIVEVLVPFTGTWHPAAVAWGVAGLYLLLAVEITSLLRAHLSKRVWRSTHSLAFPLLLVAALHGLTAGTDRHTLALRASLIGLTALAAVVTAWRGLSVSARRRAAGRGRARAMAGLR